MKDLIDQVRAANDANLFYVSLFTALALPDICGALQATDGIARKQCYECWFNANVASRYGGRLNGEVCYRFRCSMLHQGTTQHPKSPYSRVLFLEPGADNIFMHNNVFDDALNLDIRIFCTDMCEAAEVWFAKNLANPTVQANLAKFVRRHPGGLPPYIVGTPVIS